MQRFFLPTLLPDVDEVVSLTAIHKQLRQVLRVQIGTQLVVLDNQGNERLLEVTSTDRKDTMARVVEMRPAPAEPVVGITLYQSILKADKFDLVLQKATELGVTTIAPIISQRTVARPGKALQSKQIRWEAIVREAAEQSGRGGMPVLAPACTLAEAVASATGIRLLPWEDGVGSPGVLAALDQSNKPVESVSILVGPEGGLEAGEVKEAIDAGWQVVTLGSRILRAETAAIAVMAVVTSALGGLGDAPKVKVAAASQESDKKVSPKKAAVKAGSEKQSNGTSEAIQSGTAPETELETTEQSGSVGTPTVSAA